MSASAETTPAADKKVGGFTGYQKFVVAILAFLQFTIILDFMIISPLGAMVMPALSITTQQFGWIVSVYAFSAGVSGIAAAGFADRFDRKKLLLFFYVGFILGTLLCGVASTFHLLLAARIVTGVFAGVIGSVVLAIATDLFPLEMRGRVMGLMQSAFAASQIMGLPAGLFFSNLWDWHAPFVMIVVIGTVVGIIIALKLKPVDAHLHLKQERSPIGHLIATLTEPRHTLAFCTTALLATGGYMLMPFGSAFTVNNLKISLDHLPTIYLITGICTMFIGPVVGRLSDKVGKFQTFLFGTTLSVVMVLYYTRLGATPLWGVILINVLLFVGIFSRMIPSQALMTAIPEITKRGAFNAISSSIQQVSGGFASVLAGALVLQSLDGHLEHFERLGYVVVGASLVSLFFMSRIHRAVPERTA
ncbi:MAG: MFS transporter [Rhodospirillaceae bacterium]|nr:MFS transporter [Rhodospirillaceae bacterium]